MIKPYAICSTVHKKEMWPCIRTTVLAYANHLCCPTYSTENYAHFPRIIIKIPMGTSNAKHAHKFDIIGRRRSLECDAVAVGYGFHTFRTDTAPSSSKVEEPQKNTFLDSFKPTKTGSYPRKQDSST